MDQVMHGSSVPTGEPYRGRQLRETDLQLPFLKDLN